MRVFKITYLHIFYVFEVADSHKFKVFCSGNLKVDTSNRAGAQRRGNNMAKPAA